MKKSIRYWINTSTEKISNSNTLKDIITIVILFILLVIVLLYLILNNIIIFSFSKYIFEILVLSAFLLFSMFVFSYRRYKDYKIAAWGKLKAESQSEKNRDQLQSVLDSIPEYIIQFDLSLRVAWANKITLNFAPELIGNFAYEYFNYERGTFIENYAKWAIDSKNIESGIQFQTSLLFQKGPTYWEITAVPLFDKNKIVYGATVITRDITSRMRLENTWNLLSSVVESTDDAIYGLSINSIVISWNRGAEEIYNYEQEEIIGKSIDKIVLPLDRKVLSQIIENVMRSEKLNRFESIRIKKDGTKITVQTTICPLVDANAKKIGVSVIERDITEAKKAQEQLLESENFNRTIISSVTEGIVVYNSNLNISSWNASMEQITGLKAEDVINKKTLNIFTESLQLDMQKRLNDSLSGKTVYFQDVFIRTIRKPDGAWFNITFSPHINKNTEIIGVIATYRDITKSKIAEVALAFSEEKYRQLVENVSEAIANIAVDSKVLFVNEVAANLVNKKPEEIIGKSIFEIVPDEVVIILKNELQKYFKHPVKRNFDYTIDIPQYGNKSFFISLQPVINSDMEINSLMCLITDITYRKNAERELEHSQEMLRNLAAHLESVREDERKEIAFEVHDELGQELTALKLDLSWIEGKLMGLQPKLKEKISEMKALIDTTIDRVGNISTKLRPDILDHFGLLAAIEWATGDFQKRSGINSELIFDPEEINVDGDSATVIFRILQETLTNVIRHSKADTVEVIFAEKKEKFELSVTDNGVGITQDRIDAPDSFGLFAINERARSVGGSVEIIGKNGIGTQVKLIIPKKN